MCNHPSNIPDRDPVEIPIDDRDRTPRSDYTALMQRLHDLRQELDEERTQRRQAEDTAWARVAERLDELAGQLREESNAGGATDFADRMLKQLENLFQQQSIQFVDVTGKHIGDVSPEAFEVLCTKPTDREEDDGLIVETFRPQIRRGNRTIRTGRVIVLKTREDSTETRNEC